MESSTTNRGKPGLLYEGFRYRKQKDTKETRLWRCVKKACNARCKSDLDETVILGGQFEHNHAEEDDRTLERQVLRQTCKKKATEEPCEKPYKLIISEVEKNQNSELLPQGVRALRQAVYGEWRKTQPKLPKSRSETLEILNTYELSSNSGEAMIQVVDGESEIVMFSTETNLKLLGQDVHLFGDETFQFCPKFFYQLYTIHTYKNGQYIPCVYFLLPSKTKQCYQSMFRHLIDACAKFDVTLNISHFH